MFVVQWNNRGSMFVALFKTRDGVQNGTMRGVKTNPAKLCFEHCGFNLQVHGYDDFDDMYSFGYSDVNDYSEDEFYEDYEFSDGSAVSDYDYFDL